MVPSTLRACSGSTLSGPAACACMSMSPCVRVRVTWQMCLHAEKIVRVRGEGLACATCSAALPMWARVRMRIVHTMACPHTLKCTRDSMPRARHSCSMSCYAACLACPCVKQAEQAWPLASPFWWRPRGVAQLGLGSRGKRNDSTWVYGPLNELGPIVWTPKWAKWCAIPHWVWVRPNRRPLGLSRVG